MISHEPDNNILENPSIPAQANGLKAVKKQLRREIMTQIRSLPASYTVPADHEIIRLVEALPEYRKAKTVFCFVGSDTEINTAPLLEDILASGRELAVPLCITNRIMQARRIHSLNDLSPGYYGLLEPSEDSEPVQPQELDLAIIPCVSCSHYGTRLGHGGGYYDIYFSQNRDIPTAMICRDRITRDDIPKEDHDLVFPLVVTEKGVFRA